MARETSEVMTEHDCVIELVVRFLLDFVKLRADGTKTASEDGRKLRSSARCYNSTALTSRVKVLSQITLRFVHTTMQKNSSTAWTMEQCFSLALTMKYSGTNLACLRGGVRKPAKTAMQLTDTTSSSSDCTSDFIVWLTL